MDTRASIAAAPIARQADRACFAPDHRPDHGTALSRPPRLRLHHAGIAFTSLFCPHQLSSVPFSREDEDVHEDSKTGNHVYHAAERLSGRKAKPARVQDGGGERRIHHDARRREDGRRHLPSGSAGAFPALYATSAYQKDLVEFLPGRPSTSARPTTSSGSCPAATSTSMAICAAPESRWRASGGSSARKSRTTCTT